MTEIAIDWSPGEARIAVTCNSRLIDFALWRPGKPDGVGELHCVRITRTAPIMKGAFGQSFDGRDFFISGSFEEGALVTGRVTRAAQGGKVARLQTVQAEVICNEPKCLEKGPSSLERLAAHYQQAPILIDTPSLAARLPSALRSRFKRVARAFDEDIEEQCSALIHAEIALPGGMSAILTPTAALFAVDLNDAEISSNSPRTQFDRNVGSFEEIALQIRLRNINGVILIDPAGVPTRKRPALMPHLRAAFHHDPLKPHDFGATPSGLLELTRPRREPPLHELLASPHGVGLAALRQVVRAMNGVVPDRTLCLKASFAVIDALKSDREALDDVSQRLGYELPMMAIPDYPPTHWSFS